MSIYPNDDPDTAAVRFHKEEWLGKGYIPVPPPPSGGNSNNAKRKILSTNKYSKLGNGDLYESVILGGVPSFLRYDKENDRIVPHQQIEEETRILKPPNAEEYSYIPYEFSSLEELDKYLKEARAQSVDSLFRYLLDIVGLYNDQDRHIQTLITLDIYWTYFQDRFPTTHYLYVSGENESGKSTIGNTFEAVAYRCINMTNPSEANIFRIYGNIEAGQCTLVLDEFDRIDQSQSSNIMALLKTGYDHDKKIAKVNTNSLKQEFFWTFGKKVMIGERSPNEEFARGVLDRTFSITSYAGDPKEDIKETLNHQGDRHRLRLYEKLIGFRKLMLVYRLIHFKHPIPDIDINIQRRNKELCKPYIQLFCGSESQKEIEQTLEKFLQLKNGRKATSIENILLPLITDIAENENPIPTGKMWSTITKSIEGEFFGSNEFHSVDYGKLYRNKVIQKVKDKFGPTPERLSGGKRAWRFDIDKLRKIEGSYNTEIKIKTTLKIPEIDSNDSSDSYDSTLERDDSSSDKETANKSLKVEEFQAKNEEKRPENGGFEPGKEPEVSGIPSQPSQPSLNEEDKAARIREYERLSALSRKKWKNAAEVEDGEV